MGLIASRSRTPGIWNHVHFSCLLCAQLSASKLIRYSKDFDKMKSEEADSSSPLRVLQSEAWELRDQCSKLEKENEMLAEQLMTSKTDMQRKIEQVS